MIPISQLAGIISQGNNSSGLPNAGFIVSPTSGIAPFAVTVTSTATGTGLSTSYAWGDGATSSGPGHTYASAGSYTITQTVTDSLGRSASTTQGVAVSAFAVLPSWRTAMTSTLKLYSLGPANINTVLQPQFSAPIGGTIPDEFYDPQTRSFQNVNTGWNSSVYVPDAGGAFGKFVYFEAGEGYWGNTSTAWDLEAASLEKWQDNYYCISEASAAAQDADAYWSPTDAAGMFTITAGNYATWVANGRTYPYAYGGWVIRRKLSSYTHGNGRHYVGRYDSACYVPPSLTGTGAGAIVVNGNTWRGPWGGGPGPGYGVASDWHASVASDGTTPRSWLYWQDVSTKTWHQSVQRIPDGVKAGVDQNPTLLDLFSGCLRWITWGASIQTYSMDLSGGLAAAMFSGLSTLTLVGPDIGTPGERGSWVFTNGHPGGRRLAFIKNYSNSGYYNYLIVVDFDAGTYNAVGQIAGLNTGVAATTWDSATESNVNCGTAYVPTQGTYGTLYFPTKSDTQGARLFTVPLPADPLNAANYSGITCQQLSLDTGVTLDNSSGTVNVKMYGQGRAGYWHPDLGVFILSQSTGPMLAYRPF